MTKDQQRLVRKNLREYSRGFDEEDAAEDSFDSAELIANRKRLVDEWNAWRAKCKLDVRDEKKGQKLDAEKEYAEKEEIEIWVDEVIEQIEEEVVE